MSVLGQENESGLVVTEQWPGYESYHEKYERQIRKIEPTAADVTENAKPPDTTENGTEVKENGCGVCSIFSNPLVWLALILAIGGEALFSPKEKEPWER